MTDAKTKPDIEQVAWVFEKISTAIKMGGCTYRCLIYNIMGFPPEAYERLCKAGGMSITNVIEEALGLRRPVPPALLDWVEEVEKLLL